MSPYSFQIRFSGCLQVNAAPAPGYRLGNNSTANHANLPVLSDKELACWLLYGHQIQKPPPPSVDGRAEIPAPLGNELGIMVSLEHGISLRLQQTLAHREPRQRCLEGESG